MFAFFLHRLLGYDGSALFDWEGWSVGVGISILCLGQILAVKCPLSNN